jgi:hypothetical protein
MIHRFASSPPANDNRDLYATPEGAYFQILKARRRHLKHDTSRMSPERFRQWREVLNGLNEAEEVGLAWLRKSDSTPAARSVMARLHTLAGLLISVRLGPWAGRRRH